MVSDVRKTKVNTMSEGKSKIGILGGDGRSAILTSLLSKKDVECAVWGFPKRGDLSGRVVKCGKWECAVNGADAVILPLPVTFDGVRLNCRAISEEEKAVDYDVRITEIVEAAGKDALILAGKIPASALRFTAEHGKRIKDYYESEEFQIKNALPTAEGAIGCAMSSLPFTLSQSSVAVTGYGRIGRTLAHRLIALGADVTCIARSRSDLSWAWVDGCRPLPLDEYRSDPRDFDAIFNTVPHTIFSPEIIARLDPDTVFIELASQSGIDAAAAKGRGIRVIRASSLPGRCSPVTAGKILYEAVAAILVEEGIL
ncbi:MAG: hypothetical protein IJK58_09600 [Clostridia bacterium]|nr:hypothetical protein [Clostridia bacterium]